jgi:DNA polymerase-3 subunit delta
MKLEKAQLEKFLKQPPENVAAVLIFGPDEGMVRERGSALTRAVAESLDDPFRVVELAPDALKDDPARLSDEANAIPMLGGRRAVRLTRVTDGLGDVIEAFLESHRDSKNALAIFEAGDLGGKSALKKLFESLPHAAAIACYRDEARDLGPIIESQAKAAGCSIAPDALAYLVQSLGADRGVTRTEIEKLLLYVGAEKKRIELADAMACIGDQSAFALDDLCYAIGDGDQKAIERYLDLNLNETGAISVLRALARHFTRLHAAVGRIAAGASVESAVASLRPPLFWNVKQRFERQCRRWSPARIADALVKLGDTEAQAMRHHNLAETLPRRCAAEIGSLAGR